MNTPNGRCNLRLLLMLFIPITGLAQQAQELQLMQCFRVADTHNIARKAQDTRIKAAKEEVAATKNAYLPKVDLLASYNYLSRPLEVNLQQVRDGVVEGSSQQSVATANSIFKEITGNDLSPAAQNRILESSRTIIGTAYPNYNPPLAAQSYFLAGVGVRQPIYLGNKVKTGVSIASSNLNTITLTNEVMREGGDLAIAIAYLRLMHLNQLLQVQQDVVLAFTKNEGYAESLVKNEIIPPYQKSWASVALQQAQTNQANYLLEQQNARLLLHQHIGVAVMDSSVMRKYLPVPRSEKPAWNTATNLTNPALELYAQKSAYLQHLESINKSTGLPNLFAIGNLNLYQRDLPATLPPWMIGLELQWTLFNGGQTKKRSRANAWQIEANQQEQQMQAEQLETGMQIAENKMRGLYNQYESLGAAIAEAKRTIRLIEERSKNQLASPKDVNEAWLVLLELQKTQSYTQLGYYIALAEYCHLQGNTRAIVQFVDGP